jgi:D-glycero-D-manno-heptose 1,7-bisphosphate phosphatase
MRGLIFLDRDGVLNEMVVDREHGTIDSPLHPDQVKVFPYVPKVLRNLQDLGFSLAVVTNQPAAAKGKTTRESLQQVHDKILQIACSEGATIQDSEICYHRAEDGCKCRKPKTGMLEAIWRRHPGKNLASSWMIGDGVTDMQAGASFGLNTVFLAPKKSDLVKVMGELSVEPSLWCRDLQEAFERLKE